MSHTHNKLELRWHGKDDWESPEPRLLIEKNRYRGEAKGIDDNLLIFGDNLIGLKSLERDYTNKIKCIYIDPPYNTKSCFQHYNDNLEHSIWLNMMKDRLVILHRLLREDGSIWISIDDSECHYLKVMCDEIFGRRNFVGHVVWQSNLHPKGYKNRFSLHHAHLLVFGKSSDYRLGLLERTEENNTSYSNPDKDPNGPWCSGPVANSLYRKNLIYPIHSPTGKLINPPQKGWRWKKETMREKIKSGQIIFRPDETGIIHKIYLKDQLGKVPETIWFAKEVGTNHEGTKESKKLFGKEDCFSTPKPERLLQRIIHLATDPGDIVLDSFAGSGTTGAVAHKMGRRWIMIELGDHCYTHIIPRMEKVITGDDPGGVTQMVEWEGGGGFRYCELASSLLEKNRLGRWTINKEYNPAMLSEAVCMLAGYHYAPKRHPYWMHGYSTERDFIYVTAQTLTKTLLTRISEEVGEDCSLMIYCAAFKADGAEFDNLTIRKIPKMILNKCAWGKDDFSLRAAMKEDAEQANKAEHKTYVGAGFQRETPAIAAQGRQV